MATKDRYTQEPGMPHPYSANVKIFTAMRIATRYSHRLPTTDELKHDFNMSRATAYRWLAALRDARATA